jgi:hypothetical protein
MNNRSVLRGAIGLAVFSGSFIGSYPQKAADIINPVGSYVKVTGDDGEHANGHQIRLWRVGNQLVGELTYWDSNIEGQQGDFKDGSIDSKTSEIQFRVTVERNDIDPKEYSSASFKGYLKGPHLEGALKWEGEAAKWRGENGIERLKLPKETKVKLLSFPTIKDWVEARFARYKSLK